MILTNGSADFIETTAGYSGDILIHQRKLVCDKVIGDIAAQASHPLIKYSDMNIYGKKEAIWNSDRLLQLAECATYSNK